MKKWTVMLVCLALGFALAGCGNNNSSGRTGKQSAGVNDVLETGMAKEDSKKADTESQNTESESDSNETRQNGVNENAPAPEAVNESETAVNNTDGIDVDLTTLSSTMVYSEVYNMLVSPENYVGKMIKMDGIFASYHDEETDKYYFACIISDAAACCSQGIEFELTDGYSYPDDYPKEGDEICVTGLFDTYQEGDYTYCVLRNAKIV